MYAWKNGPNTYLPSAQLPDWELNLKQTHRFGEAIAAEANLLSVAADHVRDKKPFQPLSNYANLLIGAPDKDSHVFNHDNFVVTKASIGSSVATKRSLLMLARKNATLASHALELISCPHLTNSENVFFTSSNPTTLYELRIALKAFNYCLGLRAPGALQVTAPRELEQVTTVDQLLAWTEREENRRCKFRSGTHTELSALTLSLSLWSIDPSHAAASEAHYLLGRGISSTTLNIIETRSHVAGAPTCHTDAITIELSTAHSAKGFESYAVLLCDDFPPIFEDDGKLKPFDDGSLLEEIHIAYVAITRATHVLVLPPGLQKTLETIRHKCDPPAAALGKKRARSLSTSSLESEGATQRFSEPQ
jgi:hypothetical protein